MPIKSTGTQQRWVQHVRAVGCRKNDHRVRSRETVHFAQNLVECLFTLVVTTPQSGATLTANGVDFINKDDGRRILLGRSKKISNATRSDTHKHLDEFRSANGVVRHVRFACDGTSQQSFSSTGRSVEQNPLGDSTAKFSELVRFFEVLHNLLKIGFDAFKTCDVFECDLLIGTFVLFRWTATEAGKEASAVHHLTLLSTNLTPNKKYGSDHECEQDDRQPSRGVCFLSVFTRNIVFLSSLHHALIVRGVRRSSDCIEFLLKRLSLSP